MEEKKKILLVDDEQDFTKMLTIRLESKNYRVVTAGNGKEGLEKAAGEKPDLILLDILMPEMDGYTMLKELKHHEGLRDIPVIMLTAKGKMRDLFKTEGVSEYITKPFESEELLLRIKNVLGQKDHHE